MRGSKFLKNNAMHSSYVVVTPKLVAFGSVTVPQQDRSSSVGAGNIPAHVPLIRTHVFVPRQGKLLSKASNNDQVN